MFVGFKNYIEIFSKDTSFWKSLGVTFQFAFISVPYRLIFALIVAIILMKSTKMTAFYRAGLVGRLPAVDCPVFLCDTRFFRLPDGQFHPRAAKGAGRGCEHRLRIVLPLIVPALITAGIFPFLWRLDDFLSALLYVGSSERYPVSLALKLFCDSDSTSGYGAMFAMATLSILPSVLIFIFLQRYLVEVISTSGLKG